MNRGAVQRERGRGEGVMRGMMKGQTNKQVGGGEEMGRKVEGGEVAWGGGG